MNKVEPIRDQKKIEEIKAYLKNWNEKYYMMWLLGSNIGLRVSDIMKIKVDDIAEKDHLLFRDEKTNKEHRLPVNRHLRREIANYIEKEQLKPDDYIIPSQKEYPIMLNILNTDGAQSTFQQRRQLAYHAFKVSSHYDAAICEYFRIK